MRPLNLTPIKPIRRKAVFLSVLQKGSARFLTKRIKGGAA